MRLDENKLETLRRWGEGLRQAGGEEYAAAGRAILMLIEEIEQLHIDLWHGREQLSRATSVASDETAEEPDEPLALTLHERLQRVLRRDSDAFPGSRPRPGEEAAPSTESDGTKTSPQSWIEGLRRQK
jgi:hypothetical protein